MEKGTVQSEHVNGIAEITFHHPQSNSLPGELLRELAAEIKSAAGSPEVKIIVLKSGGNKSFCAGASFDELMQIQSLEQGTYFFSGFAEVINAIRQAPQLVAARVQGKAVGGGVGLAAASDIVYAFKDACVKLSELAVGIGPFVVGPAVERKIGKAAFMNLAIRATEWQSAEWAFQNGLYNRIFDSMDELDQSFRELVDTLASSSPQAMQELKKIFWEGTGNWNNLLAERAAISGRLVLSEFTRNAIEKFKSRK